MDSLKSIIEKTSTAFLILDAGTILFANPIAAKLFGFENSEHLIDKKFSDLILNEDLGIFNQEKESFEFRTHTQKWVHANQTGIQWQDKEATLYTLNDISDLKLKIIDYKASEKRLQEINANKDKFLSVIAHDLKSPFNTIIGFSNLLMDEEEEFEEEEFDEIIEVINTTSKETYSLLINLLEWARSQAGIIKFRPSGLKLLFFIQENIELFANNAHAKEIQLNVDVDQSYQVFADKNMLNIILRNLISNAIKFTDKKGHIKIKAKKKADMVQLSIQDDGKGMEKEQIKSLFDMEKAMSTEGTASEKGTGLGLILCKEFVDKNQGKIWVESEKGKGSTFFVELPHHAV